MRNRYLANDRRGVTMLEVAVASSIFVAVLALIWGLPAMGRRAEKAGERDAALEASLLAQERVETDLSRVVSATTGRPAIAIGPDGRSMRFLVLDRPPTAGGAAAAGSEISYELETKNDLQRLVRVEGARREILAGTYLRDTRFELAWTSVGWMLRARFRLEVEKRTQHTVFAVRLQLPG